MITPPEPNITKIDQLVMGGILDSWIQGERIVALRVKPCPIWLPKFGYRWLLRKMLVLEERVR